MRKLISGRKVVDQSTECAMTIKSYCPEKWLFVDLETGDIWHITKQGKKNLYPHWRGASPNELQELHDTAEQEANARHIMLKHVHAIREG